MKRLYTFLFLIFFTLQTPSLADDIKDFQIEGISVGDSLLDYFSEKEIEMKKKNGFIYPNKDFYSATFRSLKYETYESVQFHLKTTDKKYIIYSISGKIYYKNNINECYPKLDEIVSEIRTIFENSTIDETGKVPHFLDNKSTVQGVYIDLESGDYITVECYDWFKDDNKPDSLTISIDTKEFANWLTNFSDKE